MNEGLDQLAGALDIEWCGSRGHSGLALPDGILEKVYHKNAERLFSGFRENRIAPAKKGGQ